MNISDEWEAPEKQPFKDFVSASLGLYLELLDLDTVKYHCPHHCFAFLHHAG